MNDLSHIVLPEMVFPDLKGEGRKPVLCRLATEMATAMSLDKHVVLSGLMARERLGSTGIGGGVAIPHTHLPGLSRPVGGFAHLRNPVDFDAADGQPCDLIFILLAPLDNGSEHLRALAGVSRLMRQPDIRSKLRKAVTREAILSILAPEISAEVAA